MDSLDTKTKEVTVERVADGNFYALRSREEDFCKMEDFLEDVLVKEKSLLVSGLIAREHMEESRNDCKVPKFLALVRRQQGTSHDVFIRKLRDILPGFELSEITQRQDGMCRTLDKILTDKQVVCVTQRYFYEQTLVGENVCIDGCFEEDMIFHLPVRNYYEFNEAEGKPKHMKYGLPSDVLGRFRTEYETVAIGFFSPQADGTYSYLAMLAGFR